VATRPDVVSTVTAPAGTGEPSPRRTRLAPGTLVDRYQVIEHLGEGSMGCVYRARDLELGRDVALKWIQPGRIDLVEREARLRREAQAMAQVEHPGVVRIYDVGSAAGQLFVAMELARGGTLSDWLRARPRRWREVVRVFLEAGRGLAAAHHAGLVHRDVKPGNILLDAHGRAKVSDFGLARTLDRDDDGEPASDTATEEPASDTEPATEVERASAIAAELAIDADLASNIERATDIALPADAGASITRTGAVVGTLPYMAPEQLRPGDVDARADQFAFCVALWEALCGRRPFRIAKDGSRTPEMFLQAIHAGLIEGGADIPTPRRILTVLRRGLAVDRGERWRSMDELLDALQRAARPPRGRWLVAALLGGIAALLLVVVGVSRSEQAARPACGKRDQIAGAWNTIVRAGYLAAAIDLETAREDAGWFAWYAAALEADYAASCERSDAQRIACLDDAVDDLRAAVVRSDRELWPRLRAIDRCGTVWRERDLGQLHGDGAAHALLSTDGRHAFVFGDGYVPTMRAFDGSEQREIAKISLVRSLPDGTLAGENDDAELVVYDPTIDRTIRTFAGVRNVVDVSSDLRVVARQIDDRVEVAPIASGPALVAPIANSAGAFAQGAFSPDDRRLAVIARSELRSPVLYIDDLASRHRAMLAVRLHQRGIGNSGLLWLDSASVVVTGSAIAPIAGDLWRVRVDDNGAVVEPPQVLRRGDLDTATILQDIQRRTLLASRFHISAPRYLIDETSSSLLPGSGLLWPGSDVALFPVARNHTSQRLLAATNASRTRWAWMPLDLSSASHLRSLDGVRDPVLSPTGIAAIDRRSQPPAYVSFDEDGVELARVPIHAARGAQPALRCGTQRCVAMWVTDGAAYTMTVEDRAIGPVVRHDDPALARMFGWDLAPGGHLVAGTVVPDGRLVFYDLDRAVARPVTSLCKLAQKIRFLSDGTLLLVCEEPGEFVLVSRDPQGRERIRWHGTAWIEEMVPFDDHRVVMSTVVWEERLVALEMP
jgi:serine/threonine protein kinase